MVGQGWVEYGLAVAMVATAAYCATCLVLPRLRRATSNHDADLVHVVMAVAMAAMLLGVARPLWGGPLVLVFAAPACWFAWRALQSRRRSVGHAQLSVAGIAMIYMSGVVPGFGSRSSSEFTGVVPTSDAHQGMGHAMTAMVGNAASSEFDFALAGALLYGGLAAFAFVTIGQLAASADDSASQVRQHVWPYRLTLCCQLAMVATMAHMIASMI